MREEVTSADGTKIDFLVEGQGPTIVIVHGGSQHASDWMNVARHLIDDYCVVRVDRALYAKRRPVAQHTMRREIDDLDAVITRIARPVVLIGHSSGGVVALEFATQHPAALAALILYEPPVAVDAPLGGEALLRAEAAIMRRDYSTAMKLFLTELVQFSPALVWLARRVPFVWREMCALAPEQIADVRAIENLGIGLARYRAVDTPTLLLGGAKSPVHLRRRLQSLAQTIPRARIVTANRWGHLANLRSPKSLAQEIRDFTKELWR